jgi:hypothetical protein
MSRTSGPRPLLLAGLVVVTACAPLRRAEKEDTSDVPIDRGAFVLTGSALKDGPGTLLGAMSGKVPSFRVKRNGDRCPDITLRSQVSFQQLSNPHIYVDGTRATDTCILETLYAVNVERVEVYPQGHTMRPGYSPHGPGLILVFMRSG